SYSDVLDNLDGVAEKAKSGKNPRDFALLETGRDAFSALHSVGFLGIQDETDGSVRFCHDGSNTQILDSSLDRKIVIHPCYWRALEVQSTEFASVQVRVDDEHDVASSETAKAAVIDVRLRKLGQIAEELHAI